MYKLSEDELFPSSDPIPTSQDPFAHKQASESIALEIPEISLPKGGGALRGIDEQFEVNPSNGTASLHVPIPLTPGRNGFSPSLSLTYNSGAGNSPYGLGWSMNYPMIQRKTDQGLPRYQEGQAEDIFMLKGAEDLVPCLVEGTDGWEKKESVVDGFLIQVYQPRIQGDFARIEKITDPTGQIYWKLTSRDNITTFFGRDENSRIADPDNSNKIYAWLAEFSYDDQGNWIQYLYESENLDNVPQTLHEQHRFNQNARFINKYLKKSRYGNLTPFYPNDPFVPTFPSLDSPCFFEVIMDYGEHDTTQPSPAQANLWNARPDAFSSYRAGFEIRTYRRCERILMFHQFEELGEAPCLVRSLDLTYSPSSINDSEQSEVSYLSEVSQKGYIRREDGSYSMKALPSLCFDYQEFQWNTEIHTVDPQNLAQAPEGLSERYQWVDLYGEGVSGILTEQAEAWHYKENIGAQEENGSLRFSPAKTVIPKPSFTGLTSGVLSLQDLEANGQKQVVINQTGLHGYFELDQQKEFGSFQAFRDIPSIDLNDPNVRLIDLNGDGQAELVLTEEHAFVWYASDGKNGYQASERSVKTFDEEKGPAILFADTARQESILLADMSGDGLTDIVRLRNGDISYWPNMGYGKFGAKVSMSHAPRFDHPDQFNPQFLHLADISGTGAMDILYLGTHVCQAYLNLSGNAWSNAHEISPFFPIHDQAQISVLDLLATGTACIVWSSDLPADQQAPMRYIDLMNSRKPHLMVRSTNKLGKETQVAYKSSSHFYLKDKREGKPWLTKLPFPVQVVSQLTVEDPISHVRLSTDYHYHHGYYDHAEREFRGFGMVEQVDTESYETWAANATQTQLEQSEELYQSPVLTKTWYHTGAPLEQGRMLAQFADEYWLAQYNATFPDNPLDISEPQLGDAQLVLASTITNPNLLDHLSAEEWREAYRACKGMVLRQEVFALDGEQSDLLSLALQAKPYAVTSHSCQIQLLQARQENPFAVFLTTPREKLTIHYERAENDPRISHDLHTQINELGQVLERASVVYPRQQADLSLPSEIQQKQAQIFITYHQTEYTDDLISPEIYRLRKIAEQKMYEITGLLPSDSLYQSSDFDEILTTASTEIAYEASATSGLQRRNIEHVQSLYYDEDLVNPLTLGQLASHGISYERYQLAFSPSLLQHIFGEAVNNAMLEAGAYVERDSNWWIPSGRKQFLDLESGETITDVRARFFSPLSFIDPFDSETTLSYYGSYFLLPQSIRDALGNQVEVETFNFRSVSPTQIRDINGNLSAVVLDELGLVKAMAIMGKSTEADNLSGISEITEESERLLIQQYFITSDTEPLRTTARQLLQQASQRFVYDFESRPIARASIKREQHHALDPMSPLQLSFDYTDGMGKVIMSKRQAEPGEALSMTIGADDSYTIENIDTGDQLRWIGTGRQIFNNKGKPVKQYEPYFSVTPFYEEAKELVERGVTAIQYYDPLGRKIQTSFPDGTLTKVELDTWRIQQHDQQDTVMDSQWYIDRGSPDPNLDPPTDSQQLSAWKAAQHHDTPLTIHLDPLARPIYQLEHNRLSGSDEFYGTRIDLDIEGNTYRLTDHRGNPVVQYLFNLLGHQVYQSSMDAGERWTLNNVAGNPIEKWDSRGHYVHTNYDALQRPIEIWLQKGADTSPALIERMVYGESQPSPETQNVRGQVYQHDDSSGRQTYIRWDIKGNLEETQKQLASDYEAELVDWSTGTSESNLEAEIFTQITQYDALSRITRQYNWHRTEDHVAVYEPIYNDRQTLVAEDHTTAAQIDEAGHSGGRTIRAVSDIAYNEKGQRTQIRLANGITTRYQYDSQSFRLIQMRSSRATGDGPLPSLPSNLSDPNVLQNLYYHYDAVGNITEIEDDAFEPVFFQNQSVEAKSRYSYDALYRLIRAEGRENNTFNAAPTAIENSPLSNNFPRTDQALRNYIQNYQYDAVGNIQGMRHVSGAERWTRSYDYEANNNRLSRSWTGSDATAAISYQYDLHGNMRNYHRTPEEYQPQWDYADRMHQLNLGGGGTAYYQYSADRIRSRKRIERNGGLVEERIYLGGMELYRRWQGSSLLEEIETHHLYVEDQRVLMIEEIIQTDNTNLSTGILDRYQLSNHLGSVALEMDGGGAILSYEEYHPFGTVAYRAVNASIIHTAKRYRYTGMERDEESGLSYHAARYYLPWLGRWLQADPIGIEGGTNLYAYATNNPIHLTDRTGLDPDDETSTDEASTGDPPESDSESEPETPSPEAEGTGPGESLQLRLDPEVARQILGIPSPLDASRAIPYAIPRRRPPISPSLDLSDPPELPLRQRGLIDRLVIGAQRGAAAYERRTGTFVYQQQEAARQLLAEDEAQFRLMTGRTPSTPNLGGTLTSAATEVADQAELIDQAREFALGTGLPITIFGVSSYVLNGVGEAVDGDSSALTGALNTLSSVASEIPMGDTFTLRLPGSSPITAPGQPEDDASSILGVGLGGQVQFGDTDQHRIRLDTNTRFNTDDISRTRFGASASYRLTF